MGEKKKSGFLKRLVKFVAIAVGVVVLVALLAVLTLPLWINPVATTVSEAVVPRLTGTAFRMGAFRLNPYTGSLKIEEVHLDNPPGYSAKECFSVATVDVQVAVLPLTRHFIHVKRVSVVGTYASYQSHKGTNNVDAILAHVNSVLGIDPEAEAAPVETAPEETAAGEPFRVRIESLSVSGTRLQVSEIPVALPIPPLSLSGIGSPEGGSSISEVSDTVCGKIMESGGSALSAVGNVTGAAAGALGDGLKAGAAGVTDGAKAVTGALGDGAKAVGDGAKAVTGTLGDGAKAVGDGAKAVTGTLTDGAKAVTDGLKDGTKALKNLFK